MLAGVVTKARPERALLPLLSSTRSPGFQRFQRHGFFGIAQQSSPGGVYVTKYRITKPGKEGTDWDDFLLALPDKDQLASASKDVPLFVKYLKIVTDKEGRTDDFKEFVGRVKDGLQVESDVYVTTEELLALMWKNGYADKERTSLQYTFPSDYKFHYPELSVLFDLSEEDTYKFCMRTRMEKSHIGELQTAKVKRMGWVRDHWLLFGAGAFIFKTFPFFNYYFVLKGFGTTMWIWTFYTAINRWIAGSVAKTEHMASQKTAADVMGGEDKIMDAMKRFANDSKCLDHLDTFKGDVSTTMADYRQALIENEKNAVLSKIQKQLQAILAFEDSTNAKLQESIVREVAGEFKAKYDATVEKAAFSSALKSIEGTASAEDPVTSHFLKSMQEIDLSGKAKANNAGSVSERLAYLQQQQEEEFKRTFYVTEDESVRVKAAKTDNEITSLMKQLYSKVGFHVPADFTLQESAPLASVGDRGVGDKFVTQVNSESEKLGAAIKKAQLDGFKAAFA